MSNLTQRFLTAAVVLPIVFYLMYLGTYWFSLLVLIIVLIGQNEFNKFMEKKGMVPMATLSYILDATLVFVAHFSNEYYLNVILTVSILSIFIVQLSRNDVKNSLTSIAPTIFSLVYVAWLPSHAILLRNIGFEIIGKYGNMVEGVNSLITSPDYLGFSLIIIVLIATIMNDTGAYFAGRKFGKHKLAPVVSPNKTWEGAIAGVITSIVFTVATAFVLKIDINIYYLFALGLFLGVFGILGDLSESLLKRDVDIKDSGSFFPGHGGVLDRIDSLMFNLPVAYYFVKTFFYYEIIYMLH